MVSVDPAKSMPMLFQQWEGSGDQCGGEIYFAYSYTDQCNRTKVDTQFVQINPLPEPYFVNPPANMTVMKIGLPPYQRFG